MSEANTAAPRFDSLGRKIPEGFGGSFGGGRPRWELTDEHRSTLVTAGRMGYRLIDIGPLVGLARTTFERKRSENPEIDDLIEEGRRQLRAQLLELSFSTLDNPRDPARNQELARLHRIAKTEEPDSAKNSDEDSAFNGFEIIIRKKGDPEPTA
jgi:hypothetical protein